MKKNLRKSILKRLKILKTKNSDVFLYKLVLNSKFTTFRSVTKSVQTKLCILATSDLKIKLSKKKSFFTQIVTQCNTTWRARSIYSFFKLSRITLRELAGFGLIKGLKKSSW